MGGPSPPFPDPTIVSAFLHPLMIPLASFTNCLLTTRVPPWELAVSAPPPPPPTHIRLLIPLGLSEGPAIHAPLSLQREPGWSAEGADSSSSENSTLEVVTKGCRGSCKSGGFTGVPQGCPLYSIPVMESSLPPLTIPKLENLFMHIAAPSSPTGHCLRPDLLTLPVSPKQAVPLGLSLDNLPLQPLSFLPLDPQQ